MTTRDNHRKYKARADAAAEFETAAKLAYEHGLTLRTLAYADDPKDVTQYRIEGDGWFKEIYPGNQRIYCPDKRRQGPFISMKFGQRWGLLDVVRACIAAVKKAKDNPKPVASLPEVTGDASDTRELLVQLVSTITKAEGTTEQGAFRDLMTDIRHVADHLKLDIEEALKGSYEVYLEEKADPEFSFSFVLDETDEEDMEDCNGKSSGADASDAGGDETGDSKDRQKVLDPR